MTTLLTEWKLPHHPAERDEALRAIFFKDAPERMPTLQPDFRGGRTQALVKLRQVQGDAYGETRNYLDGRVTHLSPYLRHGCLTLNEAVTAVREQFGSHAEKLLFEFAWREYWRQVWYQHGSRIAQAMSSAKVPIGHNPLTEDVTEANTGLPCMDAFISELAHTGYLHNHARMWLASYVVHWRKMDWKLAADWMHDQLLDGDYASNHLSWQWIASTFSHKPYFFNQENLAKYTHHKHCSTCTAACPFQDSYANLESKLFQTSKSLNPSPSAFEPLPRLHKQMNPRPTTPATGAASAGTHTVVWVHDEMLNPQHPLMALPHTKVFVFSPSYYQHWSILRLQFIADCLAELPNVAVWIGEPSAVFEQWDVREVITQQTPNHHLKALVQAYDVEWHDEPHVASAIETKQQDMSSFSRFWKTAKRDYLA